MPRKNSADVAASIKRAIENGTYKRLERLPPSRVLADSFGVARNTLRDALYRLQKEGLLETKPGSGTYVTAPERDVLPSAVEEASPLELMDARFALEPHICRLCVLHGRREDFDALDALCDQMEKLKNDPQGFAEIDTNFHHMLVATTRNNLLIWLIGQINTVRSLDEWVRMRSLTLNERMIEQYNLQHREILRAMRAREPEQAAASMKRHLESARLSLTRVVDA